MSVTVHLSNRFGDPKAPITHTKGRATLVDGRGQLLVLDTEDIPPVDVVSSAEFASVVATVTCWLPGHTLATYADGAWERATATRPATRAASGGS